MNIERLEIARKKVKDREFGPLSSEQYSIINNLLNNIENNKRMQTIMMPAGSGKTTIAVIIALVCAYAGEKVLYLSGYKASNENFKMRIMSFIQEEIILSRIDSCTISGIQKFQDKTYFLTITDGTRSVYDESILTDFANKVDQFEIRKNQPVEMLSTAQRQLFSEKTLKAMLLRDQAFCIDFESTNLKEINYVPLIATDDLYIYSSSNSLYSAQAVINQYNSLFQEKVDQKKASRGTNTSVSDFDPYFALINQKIDNLTGLVEEGNKKLDEIASLVRDTNETVRENVKNSKELVEMFQKVHPQQDGELEQFENLAMERLCNQLIDSISRIQGSQRFLRSSNMLKISIGEDSWGKMDEISKKFLISAKVFFEDSVDLQDSVDYSSICVQASKAYEVEMANRLVTRYFDYLKRASIPPSQWPKALFSRKGCSKPIDFCEFSLGSCPYILGLIGSYEDRNCARKVFTKYCKDDLLLKTTDADIDQAIITIDNYVRTIREKYRNPAAHKGVMSLNDAYECLQYIVDVEKALRNTLSLFEK